MSKMKRVLLASAVALSLGVAPVLASDKHDHGPGNAMKFDSAAAGLKTLDELIAEAKAKLGKGDFEALHEVSEELQAAGPGLAARASDVPQANAERFKFNAEQIKSLGAQLEEVHETKNKADTEKVIKRLDDVRTRLSSLTSPS